MYTNKCIKCGKEFETKNPKRVICPECLYPERTGAEPAAPSDNQDTTQDYSRGYSAGSDNPGGYRRYNNRPQGGYNNDRGYNQNRSYNRDGYNQGGYQDRGGYNNRQQGGYNNDRYNNNYNRPRNNNYQRRDDQGGYQNRGYNRDNGGYNRRPYNNGGGQRPNRNFGTKRPMRPNKAKPLLVNKEQLAAIEEMYKKMLPLPNPDAHEVIATAIELEPKKVFFGINLVRQKMMLPKIPFPKRKLAITPDQMLAIKNLYEPLLPLPPIGCHKILAAQLKMDEWRVHVGIGLVRKQMGLDRWNQDREDAPEEFKKK